MESIADITAADFLSYGLNAATGQPVSVTYHAAGGDVTRNAVFDEQGRTEELDSRGRRVDVRTGLLFVAADATNGVAAPALNDEVTIDTEKWDVLAFSKHGGVWEMTVQRTTLRDRGAAGYRHQR
jgi:hypothetical protein